MATLTTQLKRERLLQLAEEYRNKGYDIYFHPNFEDLPDFLKNYRPDMIARREDESVIIEVESRQSLSSSSGQYLQSLARTVEQNPGWRLELAMANSEDATYLLQAESPLHQLESLHQPDLEARLQVARQLAVQHPESALLYTWSLAEATLRLIAERERLGLQKIEPFYLVKQLVTEGIISRFEYQLLLNALSLRNAVAHGFKTTQVTQEFIYDLIGIIEQLLQTSSDKADE